MEDCWFSNGAAGEVGDFLYFKNSNQVTELNHNRIKDSYSNAIYFENVGLKINDLIVEGRTLGV